MAQWLREASVVHALPKRESLGSTLPTHLGQSALLTSSTVGSILTSSHVTVGDVSVQTWCGTTKSTKISTASCLCCKPTRPPWTFTQPMADNYMWAVQCIRGVKVQLCMTLANLPNAAAHVGDLILPPSAACHSIERNWNNPFRASVNLLQPKAEDTKLQSSAIMLCQTNHASSRLSIYLVSSHI